MYSRGSTIQGTWKIGDKIGSGSQGLVYIANNINNGGKVAVKMEATKVQRRHLYKEYELYKSMAEQRKTSREIGIPKAYHYEENDDCAIMVMEFLGPSLEQLFAYQGRVFSSKTIILLFKHLVVATENLHATGIIHRDIKPSNICMGRGENAGVIYLIDFGISKWFRDPVTNKHIAMKLNNTFAGTVKFASHKALGGRTSSRRDDMESLVYVMMYLSKGKLPFGASNKDSVPLEIKMSRMRKSVDVDDICKGYPVVFKDVLTYVRNLEFEEKPDYVLIRSMLDEVINSMGFEDDGYFDWFYTEDGEEIDNSTENLNRKYNEILSLIRSSISGSESGSTQKNVRKKKPKSASSVFHLESNHDKDKGEKSSQTKSVPKQNVDFTNTSDKSTGKQSSWTSLVINRVKNIRNSLDTQQSKKKAAKIANEKDPNSENKEENSCDVELGVGAKQKTDHALKRFFSRIVSMKK